MKAAALRLLDSLSNKIGDRVTRRLSLKKEPGWGFDVLEVAHLKASLDSADYFERNMLTAANVASDFALLERAASLAPGNGLWLEFGVAYGRSIRHIATLHPGPVYGFDSFEGLPEDWRSGMEKGAFACAIPQVPANVALIKGWFSQTLPAFLSANPGNISLMHIDCDLYSSTRDIFAAVAPRLVSGSVIVFDEYWNYPGWQQHEHRAFLEYIANAKCGYRYDSFVSHSAQVCVVLT